MIQIEESDFICKTLDLLASQFPDYAPVLRATIIEIREEKDMKRRFANELRNIFLAIDNGRQLFKQIQDFTEIPESRLKGMLAEMKKAEVLEEVPQGGKGESARGQVNMIWQRVAIKRI